MSVRDSIEGGIKLIKWLKLKFLRYTLSIALKKAAPDRFSTSRPKSLKNDFHETQLVDYINSSSFLVRSLDAKGVVGIHFNSKNEKVEGTISNENLLNYSFFNQHYYRGFNIITNSCITFLLYRYFFIDYLTVKNENIAQYLYNRKKLSRIQRMEVLSLIVKNTINDANYKITTDKLIGELYSIRFIFHPQQESLSNYYNLILESLVSDHCLEKSKYSYKLSPEGMAGLIKFETEEQRFKQALWHNRMLAALTFGLVVTGIVQAALTYFSRS